MNFNCDVADVFGSDLEGIGDFFERFSSCGKDYFEDLLTHSRSLECISNNSTSDHWLHGGKTPSESDTELVIIKQDDGSLMASIRIKNKEGCCG